MSVQGMRTFGPRLLYVLIFIVTFVAASVFADLLSGRLATQDVTVVLCDLTDAEPGKQINCQDPTTVRVGR